MTDCPFCKPRRDDVFHEGELILCRWDSYPVSAYHALVVTRRHVADWFEASSEEHKAIVEGISIARDAILAKADPQGFNIGVNVGEAAGQSVPHLHVHVIPRYPGDVSDPRGGVRHVIPGRGNYRAAGWRPISNISHQVLDARPASHAVETANDFERATAKMDDLHDGSMFLHILMPLLSSEACYFSSGLSSKGFDGPLRISL